MVRVDPLNLVSPRRQGSCRAGAAALSAAGLRRLAELTGDTRLAKEVESLWRQARADLTPPRERDLVEFAKAVQAMRVLLE